MCSQNTRYAVPSEYRLTLGAKFSNLCQNVRYSFVPSKPALLLRLLKKTLHGCFLRRCVPRQIEIALDYRCNLMCSHCSSRTLIKENVDVLSLSEYRMLAEQTERMGIVSYIFTGGEPLTFVDRLLDVIRLFKPKRNLISIQSNTYLLSDDNVSRLRRGGVDLILGSVDTFHYEHTPSGIDFSQIDSTITLVRRNGMDMTYCTVLTHSNLRSSMLHELIEFTKKRRVLLFFNIAVPVGSWAGRKDIILNEEDQIFLRQLTIKYPHTRFDFASNFAGFGCPAFKERLYVTPYGDVLGCPFLQVSFGNLRDGFTIPEIREKAMRSQIFENYHKLCLVGEDREFMRCYLPAYETSKELPMKYNDIADLIERL